MTTPPKIHPEPCYASKYLWFRADRGGISLEEAARQSLQWAWPSIADPKSYSAIISAFRPSRPATDATGRLALDRAANQQLLSAIIDAGWGYLPAVAVLTSPDEQESIDDEAFLIGSDDDQFPQLLAALLRRLNLPSAILIPPSDETAHLIFSDESIENLGLLEVDRLSNYYARMKGLAPESCKLVGVGDRQRMTQYTVKVAWKNRRR